MLQSVKGLKGYAIEAADARVGSVKDVYFDDEIHTVRFLVVDTVRGSLGGGCSFRRRASCASTTWTGP
jgi:hypothetical protein